MSAGESYFQAAVIDGSDPLRVVASGELDAASSPVLARHLESVHASGLGIALDLQAVTFIDSSGLRIIAAEAQFAADTGGSFTIVAASAPVRRIFEMTGLSDLIVP